MESFIKQPTQLIAELNSSLQHIIVTYILHICRQDMTFLDYAKFLPLILSMIVHLLKLCQKGPIEEENGKSVFSSMISKFDFLWQLPYIQLIRHFILWNDLRKAVLEKQRIYKLCNIKGIPLLNIIRTPKLVNIQQSWHANEIRKELDKTVLSKKAIKYILQQWKGKHGETIFEGSVVHELEQIFEDKKERAKYSVMMIDSKIQTFKMYQTFGDRIPSFLLTLPIGNLENRIESIKELLLYLFSNPLK